jgi:hypothetical protein
VYVEDGAIRESEVTRDGRHRHPADESAWHLVSLDEAGEVCGCSRYIEHPNTVQFRELGVRKAALAHSKDWGMALRAAINAEVAEARRRDLSYVEVGGWALDSSMRRSAEGVRIALATYSLARILGGCIGITTATRRHCSATILRKIGGQPMRIDQFEIPPYFDPQYGCDMELLRFDSTGPNPRFESCIEDLRSYLMTATLVIQPDVPVQERTKAPAAQHAFAMQESYRPWQREAWRLGKAFAHAVQ